MKVSEENEVYQMDRSCIASYDLGTSGVKLTLVDFEGDVLGESSADYPLETPHAGWAEQNPEIYWDAVCKVTRQMLTYTGIQPDAIKGIVFCTQWKGIIPLDERDNVLHNCIIWLDGRAGAQAKKLNASLNGDYFCDKDYWAKLMWFREERPELYAHTASILEVNSYLKFRATGVKAVDITNHFTRSSDPDLQRFYDRVLDAAEIDPRLFPPIVSPSDRVGALTEQASAALGLLQGTPVFGGCGDIPAITIGSGQLQMWTSHIYFGSSGWIGTVVPPQVKTVGELFSPFGQEKNLQLYAQQSVGMTLNWALKQFYHNEWAQLGNGVFDLMNHELEGIPAGSLNLMATPWLHGERPPLSEIAKVAFINATGNHDRRHFMNAVLESICYAFRWKKERYEQDSGHNLLSLRAIGGGACSDHWMQLLADILKIPIEVPSNVQHAGAIGTAYCGLIGLGICKDLEAVNTRMQIEKTFLPRQENFAVYDKLFPVFKEIFPALEHIFQMLSC